MHPRSLSEVADLRWWHRRAGPSVGHEQSVPASPSASSTASLSSPPGVPGSVDFPVSTRGRQPAPLTGARTAAFASLRKASYASIGRPMVAGKRTHGNSQVIRRLRMSRALGIQYSRGMRPASRTRGRERRKGSWWDRENNCIAIEGQDFAQDTQEGGADQFEFLPDSDEEGAHKNPCLNGSDDEFVPETEPQDIVHLSSIGRPCNKQGHPHFGTMFQEWRRILQQEEQQCAREIATKEQNKSTTWHLVHLVVLVFLWII